MYRLFAALPVDPEIAPGLVALQKGLTGASWRPERNFHVTLRFFGALNHTQARDLDDLLGEITAPQIEIRLEGVGWFGRREPTAVWARVREDDALRALASQCERAARRMGLPPDRRPFTPHVTLAYLHDATLEDTRAWTEARQSYRSEPFWADSFHLYSSHMGNGPSRYIPEADYVLGG
ncbi:RNA 2',3'-cyclic phosphodiesterase [Hyphomonas johnsonii]|nr:RNA 2',3'-cyclic phosphodiesterase [Hyphomonas johnsonii]